MRRISIPDSRCSILVVLLLTGAFGASCGLDQGEPTLIDRPRILAMKAEPPEILSGGASTLSALVALPDEFDTESTPLLLLWGICELSGKVTGQGCMNPESLKVLGGGGHGDSIPLQDPSAGSSANPANFVVGLFAKTGEIELKAFKRFVVSSSDRPNRNPTIAAILIDGEPMSDATTIEPGKEVRFEVHPSDDSIQSYVDPRSFGGGEEKEEELFVSWFATTEGFEKDRSFNGPFENRWTAPDKAPASGRVRFYAVLHDSREGVDWKSFELPY